MGVAASLIRGVTEPPSPEIAWAWQRLQNGAVVVGELAEDVGWSERRSRERFRAEIGLAPKQAARVLRFERATMLLCRSEMPWRSWRWRAGSTTRRT